MYIHKFISLHLIILYINIHIYIYLYFFTPLVPCSANSKATLLLRWFLAIQAAGWVKPETAESDAEASEQETGEDKSPEDVD